MSTPSAIGHGRKEEAILAAALELFSEYTFNGTPVPRVAQRAGVAAGTVYRYFESKEALVNALYQRCKLEMRRVLAEGRPANLGPREEFGWLWRRLWKFAKERQQAFRFLEMHHHAAYLDDRSRAIGEDVTAPITAFVVRAQAAGALKAGRPEVLIAMALGAFVGLIKEADHGRFALTEDVLAASERAAWALLCV